MFVILLRFLRILYPVLKESLLGKQSLLAAIRTSKIKTLVFLYCLVSPFFISYMGDKVVSLATTNIALTKKLNERPIELASAAAIPLVKTASPPQPSKAEPELVVLTVSPVKKPIFYSLSPKDQPIQEVTAEPALEPEIDYNEILNRYHDYN